MNISRVDIEPYFDDDDTLQYRCTDSSQIVAVYKKQVIFVTYLLNKLSRAGYYTKKLSYNKDEGFSLDYILLNEVDSRKNPFTPDLVKQDGQWKACIYSNPIKDLTFLDTDDLELVNEALEQAKYVCRILNYRPVLCGVGTFEFTYQTTSKENNHDI